MSKTLRIALFCLPLMLLLWGPSPALGEEEPKPGAEGDKDKPKSEEPAPKADEPKEEPKKDEPKKDEPDPNAPPPGEEPEPPKTETKKGVQVSETLWPPLPEGIEAGPAGTVFLPGGKVPIGTKPAVISKLTAGRPPDQVALFLHERPEHMHYVEPVYFGRYELSNAQYRRFLDDHVKEFDTGGGGLGTIDRIVTSLWSVTERERKDIKYNLWRQFYDANKDVIWEGFKGINKLDELLVKRPGGEVDEDATAKKMRYEPLPRGIKLKYLSPVRPPTEWKGYHPEDDELDHPVRGCTYNDFERFAVWSGMHIMTEFEYEYAARGPQGNPFPWAGDTFPLTSKLSELIVNWGAKVTKKYEPTTVPCHGLPGGVSWCGVYNLVGNVAEWTSSWFENYPGNTTRNNYLGRYVKIIRGGSGTDQETVVLRPAFRNFQGNDAKGPPYPRNGYPWAGTRMAAYLESGRDQLGPITRHVVRYKKVKEHHLDAEHFKGTVSNNWTEPGAEVTNHMYVLGPSAAVVFIPGQVVPGAGPQPGFEGSLGEDESRQEDLQLEQALRVRRADVRPRRAPHRRSDGEGAGARAAGEGRAGQEEEEEEEEEAPRAPWRSRDCRRHLPAGDLRGRLLAQAGVPVQAEHVVRLLPSAVSRSEGTARGRQDQEGRPHRNHAGHRHGPGRGSAQVPDRPRRTEGRRCLPGDRRCPPAVRDGRTGFRGQRHVVVQPASQAAGERWRHAARRRGRG